MPDPTLRPTRRPVKSALSNSVPATQDAAWMRASDKKTPPLGAAFVIHDVLRKPGHENFGNQFCTKPILIMSAFLAAAKTLARTP